MEIRQHTRVSVKTFLESNHCYLETNENRNNVPNLKDAAKISLPRKLKRIEIYIPDSQINNLLTHQELEKHEQN